MHDTTSESGSDRSEASKSGRQTNHNDVQSSCSSSPAGASPPLPQNILAPSLRKVIDESENRPSGANDAQRPNTERRKRSYTGSMDETHQADEEREENLKSGPQHEEGDTGNDLKSVPKPEEWDTHDADFETSLISQRNRRVLMTRLYETAPRGRLSLVSTCARLFHCYQSSKPRSNDLCFF
jgi:hypothetical protein